MEVKLDIFNGAEEYHENLYCNEYSFNTDNVNEFDDFLDLLMMCLKQEKVMVISACKE